MQKAHLTPRNLLQFASRIDKDKTIYLGGSRAKLCGCHLCKNEYRGRYTRVYCNILWIGRQGVKGCETITPTKKIEVTRLHMDEEARKKGIPWESLQLSVSLPTGSLDVGVQGKEDSTTSTRGKKRASSVAEMFNIQSRDVADSSIAMFFYAHATPIHVARTLF